MGAIPINIADHVGSTPMVQLTRLLPDSGERYVSTPFFAPEPARAGA